MRNGPHFTCLPAYLPRHPSSERTKRQKCEYFQRNTADLSIPSSIVSVLPPSIVPPSIPSLAPLPCPPFPPLGKVANGPNRKTVKRKDATGFWWGGGRTVTAKDIIASTKSLTQLWWGGKLVGDGSILKRSDRKQERPTRLSRKGQRQPQAKMT